MPEKPGLGVELNEEVVKQHLRVPGYFEPTPEYDKYIIQDYRPGGPINLYFYDAVGKIRAELDVSSDGRPGLYFRNAAGKMFWTAP